MAEIKVAKQLEFSHNKIIKNEAFIAAAHLKQADHSGLAINVPGKGLFVFHYAEGEIELEKIDNLNSWNFNGLCHLDNERIDEYFNWFKKVKKNYISYGYYFGQGEFSAETGLYKPDLEISIIISNCVGFCLLVIEHLIWATLNKKVEYLKRETWEHEEIPEYWLEKTKQNLKDYTNPTDLEKAMKEIRRIPPIDYFAASFLRSPLPYTREQCLSMVQQLVGGIG